MVFISNWISVVLDPVKYYPRERFLIREVHSLIEFNSKQTHTDGGGTQIQVRNDLFSREIQSRATFILKKTKQERKSVE